MIKTIEGINKVIDAGKHGTALRALQEQFAGSPLIKKRDLFIYLKLYNRMQWLVEALPIATHLSSMESHSIEELFELALHKVLLNRPTGARQLFKQALKRNTKDPLLISEIAFTYLQQGKMSEAESYLSKLAIVYRKKGRLDDAGLRVYLKLAGLRAFEKVEKQFIEKLLIKNKDSLQAVRLAYILAIVARKNKNYEREIDLLLMANKAFKAEQTLAGHEWTQQQDKEKFELIKRQFPEINPSWLSVKPDLTPLVFILGMPRSGTTLVEQIIGAHSAVGNSGESRALDVALYKALLNLGAFTELGEHAGLRNLQHFGVEQLKHIQQGYLEYQRLLSDADVITDKQLALVDWVGLLANFFPNARFIYIQRNPLDNCASLMQHNFENAPYSNDPVSIVLESRSYSERMAYWKAQFPERIHCFNYEALTAEPEPQMKKLIKAAGLTWEPQIAQFHQRVNAVRTPSVGQVRNTINTSQVDKWKTYERLIAPAIELLDSA